MINFKDFSPVDENIKYYHFQNLIPLRESNPSREVYRNANGDIVKIIKLASIQQVYILHQLWQKDIFVNICGFNRKGTELYVFCLQSKHLSLQQIVDKELRSSLKKVFDQQFCTDLINSIVFSLKSIEQYNAQLTFITPRDIICTNFKKNLLETQTRSQKKSNSYKFNLIYPTACNIFEQCNEKQLKLHEQFIAPEQLRNTIQPKKSPFKKAILYSIGLVILYILGYTIQQSFRLEALQNPRKLRNLIQYIKGIRKQIKILHNGSKYIAKLLKLLLENSEAMRDSLDIFIYKMLSPQMQNLRKIIKQSSGASQQTIKCETIGSDIGQFNNPINGTNCTIDIKGSKNSLQRTNKDMSEILKSNKSVRSTNKQVRQQENSLPNSPITIQLDDLSDIFDKNKSLKSSKRLTNSESVKHEQQKQIKQEPIIQRQIKEQSKQAVQDSNEQPQNLNQYSKKLNVIVSCPKEEKFFNEQENMIVNWSGREEENDCRDTRNRQIQPQMELVSNLILNLESNESRLSPLNQQNILKNGFKDRSNLAMFAICLILIVYGLIDYLNVL